MEINFIGENLTDKPYNVKLARVPKELDDEYKVEVVGANNTWVYFIAAITTQQDMLNSIDVIPDDNIIGEDAMHIIQDYLLTEPVSPEKRRAGASFLANKFFKKYQLNPKPLTEENS